MSERTRKTVAEAHRTGDHENQNLTLEVSAEVLDLLEIVLTTFIMMEGKDKRKHDHHAPTHAGEDKDPRIRHDVASLINGSGLATTAIRSTPLGVDLGPESSPH